MAPSFASAAAPGRVLVTDGEFKHTLGIVRQLARRGHEVHVIARSRAAPAVHSRAVRRWHRAPASGAPDYDARLLEVARSIAPVSLVPVGNGAVAAADRLRERLPSGVGVALPTRDALCIANDKARTADFARRMGLRTPRERPVASADEAREALRELGAPLVLKSAREEGVKTVRYARDEAAVPAAFEAARAGSRGAILAQEFVAGDGYGFSALYWNGAHKRSFMHRRVREWPPSGGTSACAESLPEAPALAAAGRALLDALRWHGVAMVEFKGTLGEPAARAPSFASDASPPGSTAGGTRDLRSPSEGGGSAPPPPSPDRSTPGLALIEINAKFWGSHDLALAAGVDFPGDMVALLEGRGLGPAPDHRTAVRFAWPFGGDLWHGMFHPASLPAVLGDALSSRVAHNWRLDDPVPLFFEIAQWVRSTPGAWREHRMTQ